MTVGEGESAIAGVQTHPRASGQHTGDQGDQERGCGAAPCEDERQCGGEEENRRGEDAGEGKDDSGAIGQRQ
ncbi:MAG: hypothetical protein EA351_10325 [Gemmatimonadales bacterium]|nr:MAG: hypothetical protein EA351_10325 [Gemmatimonadales bacterium]